MTIDQDPLKHFYANPLPQKSSEQFVAHGCV